MKPKICVFHQSLNNNFGGAASVSAWVIEALKKDYEIYLATTDKDVDVNGLNQLYGTSLSPQDFNIVQTRIVAWLQKVSSNKLKSLRLAYSVKDLKSMFGEFDLIVNTANEINLGYPAIQYIHCPIRSSIIVRELYSPPESWLRLANNAVFKLVSGFRADKLGNNSVFIANSEWTANAFSRAYGLKAKVIYPPITLPEPSSDQSHDRETGFVTIGRFIHEKRLHETIDIIERVRKIIPEVHLHIVGDGKGSYSDTINSMASDRDYVTLHRNISRDELGSLVRRHRFGIHSTRYEHFGMAPAEMVTAGMIVFVHKSGGQVEIVNNIDELAFENYDEAVVKILNVLEDEELQARITAELSCRKDLFSAEIFMSKISGLVSDVLKVRKNYDYE